MIFTKQTIPNFLKAVVRNIRFWLNNKKLFADQKTVKKRIEICKKCEWYYKATDQCLVCSCFVTNFKTTLVAEVCPMKKW